MSTPLGRRAMDENKLQVEDEFEGGSMFASNKILIAMVVIALIAVLIGMGGQRSAQDKSADVYSAERSEEHTSELQSLMRISYAVFCLKKKIIYQNSTINNKSR